MAGHIMEKQSRWSTQSWVAVAPSQALITLKSVSEWVCGARGGGSHKYREWSRNSAARDA